MTHKNSFFRIPEESPFFESRECGYEQLQLHLPDVLCDLTDSYNYCFSKTSHVLYTHHLGYYAYSYGNHYDIKIIQHKNMIAIVHGEKIINIFDPLNDMFIRKTITLCDLSKCFVFLPSFQSILLVNKCSMRKLLGLNILTNQIYEICDIEIGLQSKNWPYDENTKITDCKILNDEQLVMIASDWPKYGNAYLIVWNIKKKQFDLIAGNDLMTAKKVEVISSHRVVTICTKREYKPIIRLWDTTTGQYIEERENYCDVLCENSNNMIITGSAGGIVRVWDDNLRIVYEKKHCCYIDGMIYHSADQIFSYSSSRIISWNPLTDEITNIIVINNYRIKDVAILSKNQIVICRHDLFKQILEVKLLCQ